MTTQTAAAKIKKAACKLHYKKIRPLRDRHGGPAFGRGLAFGGQVRRAVNLPALNELFARLESPSILGGNPARKDAGRFSYWAACPKEIFEFKARQDNPFGKLAKVLEKYGLEDNFNLDSRLRGNDKETLPKGIFTGGWLGYFSYELGRYIEKLPRTTTDDLKMPLIRLCFYDKVLCYDHIEGNIWLIALDLPDDIESPQEKLETLEKLLAKSQEIVIPPPCRGDLDNIDFSQIRCNIDKDYYLKAVNKIKRYIFDGEVYQINFSQRFECDYKARPIELFHWQNLYNPSPYSAYIDGGDFYIVSASPEMFITITDGVISTKPIKGTRPRINESATADPPFGEVSPSADKSANPQAKQINAKNFDELVNSKKEQAELNMIIDLERNDVARICKPGTRTVTQPRTIESYPTVFHAVATVAGQLRQNTTFCDVLRAMFPGGSITGAPKIRSMEIIDETEPTERGVYTGSIGFIGVDGNVSLNIAIRTIIIKDRIAYAQTGGGIVADSDAEAEWNETITKARALIAGINSVKRTAGSG